MTKYIKEFVRARPCLYDKLIRIYRTIGRKTYPSYCFFDEFSKAHSRRVTFIQIGVSDGLHNDPIREFVIRDKWIGIMVEPLPTSFSLLKQNYQTIANRGLVFVNAAITSSVEGDLSFWTFQEEFLNTLPPGERLSYLQKSSFHRSHVERWIPQSMSAASCLREIKVPCLTLSELVTKYRIDPAIHLLVIDAEGYETTIIPSIDFSLVRPEAIYFESHNLGAEKDKIYEHLAKNGYHIIEFAGDAVAVYDTSFRDEFHEGVS